MAIGKSRDDLARAALVEKQKCQQELATLNEEMETLEELLTDVQQDSQRLQEKLNEAKRRQESFVLRQESAQVRLKVREKAAVYNIDQAISKFERYQQKIDEVEAKIEAYDMTNNQDLASQIDALESDENVEQELSELKKKAANG